MPSDLRPLFLAGRLLTTASSVEVRSPFDGALVATVSTAGPDEYETAARACVAAAPVVAALPLHERARILRQVGSGAAGPARDVCRPHRRGGRQTPA